MVLRLFFVDTMKLIYFAGPGMADSIRSVMHHASIPLEFEGLSDEQFAADKAAGRFKVRSSVCACLAAC